jgi:hypothetical protein
MHEINKLDWVLRHTESDLDSLKERWLELWDAEAIDPYNPPDELLAKFNAINDAIEDASDYLLENYPHED